MHGRSLLVCLLFACGSAREPTATEGGVGGGEAIVLDTKATAARAQYDEDVAFAMGYVARCHASGNRPRVIVTGFGRFADITHNTTALLVSKLVPAVNVPEPSPDAPVDQPLRELAVGTSMLSLADVGEVDVCGLILPVFWDLAAIILAKEIDAFGPSFVLMNGVADSSQPMSFELGAINAAAALADGSNALAPIVPGNGDDAPIIPGVDYARPNLLSWNKVRLAAELTIWPSAVLQGTRFTPYPHAGNTYLCNNLTFVTSYLMDHPKQMVSLLQARPRLAGKVNEVRLALTHDFSNVPRVFVHWPAAMAAAGNESDLQTGVFALRAAIAAQLSDDHPTRMLAGQLPSALQ